MPTVWRQGKLRIEIRVRDHNPPHVHASLGDRSAAIDLRTFVVLANDGFNESDLAAIIDIVEDHAQPWLEMWEVYHGTKD